MPFYESNVLTFLLLLSIPAFIGLYFFMVRKERTAGLIMLLYSAFALRILMISLDPFLHEWDERFHALVAKHMINHPFKPMLFIQHILPYNMEDWGYNHIWVHKQPLFLWQMALSMKIFGVNTFALRLPSAIMGTVMVYLIYDIARMWIKNRDAAFVAALIATFSFYPLEMISGWVSLDHNDLAFTFYMTCGFWAMLKYMQSPTNKIKWALLIGLFAGLAVLNKWLTAFLIFGGWGLYVILSPLRGQLKSYLHIGFGMVACFLVFGPWQLYILNTFPQETAISYATNRKHMTEDLGHPGDALTHLKFLTTSYGYLVMAMFVCGLLYLLWKKKSSRTFTLSALGMIIVIFSFFSFLVATKMPALVYPVSALIIVIAGTGLYALVHYTFGLIPNYSTRVKWRPIALIAMSLIVAYSTFKPKTIAAERRYDNVYRNNKINNNTVFKQLNKDILEDRVVLNCRPYENIELMFYQDALAYHWYPEAFKIDSLKNIGYRFAAFDYPGDPQQLPEWIKADTSIMILPFAMK